MGNSEFWIRTRLLELTAMSRPAITPTLKVGDLLEHYPELEPALLAVSPAFSKLRNPVLRRTVARVATLEQAAKIGGVAPRDLVNTLRRAAGLPTFVELHGEGAPVAAGCASAPTCGVAAGAAPPCERPDWAAPTCAAVTLDADALLAADTHPLGIIRRELAQGPPNRIVTLRSSFRPEPLLDEMRRTGVDVHCDAEGPGRYVTYLRKREDGR
jgi:hypothetical protein